MLPEISPEQGVEAAERIRHKVAEERFGDDGESIKVTISVGVASYPESGEDAESVIRNADEALYEAKELGRNQVVLAGAQKKKKKRKKSKAK
jgi:diguanylate cyclase (GGDEF)-like protein